MVTARKREDPLWLGVLAGAATGMGLWFVVRLTAFTALLHDPAISSGQVDQTMSSSVLSTAIYALAGAVGGWVAARVHRGRWDLAPALLFALACAWLVVLDRGPQHITYRQAMGLAAYAPAVFLGAYAAHRRRS